MALMSAKVVFVSGALIGAVFPVDGVVSIGRDRDNRVRFPEEDQLVSRHHCTIEPTADRFVIRDLQSKNGTLVNGKPVIERMIEDGDRIQIGTHELILVTRPDWLPGERETVEIEEDPITFEQTEDFNTEETIYAALTRSPAESGQDDRVTRDLAALLRICDKINSVTTLNDLQSSLLELLFETTPTQHGSILFCRDAENITAAFSLQRFGSGSRKVAPKISKTLLGRVLGSNQGSIANNIATDDELRLRLSLRDVQSVLCVPLRLRNETIGAIYLDTRDAGAVFETNHLQLLTAVAAIAAGALDRARRLESLAQENVRLKEEVSRTSDIVGVSWQTDELRALIARIAPRDLWVLLQGETGVGKDLVARALHRFSARSGAAFVSINCSAIPENLLESELFGTTAKAFTNAGERKGLIEEANGGTLFLDEIGDMPLPLQAKLLTALDHGIVRRLGSNEERRVDFRLISATNKDLKKAIQEKTFRLDLFYKLHHSVIQIPPLRERPQDIEPLAHHFLKRAAEKFKCNVHDFSSDALAFLSQHQWPGNVRELDFTIRSAVGVCESDVIQRNDFSSRMPISDTKTDVPVGPWNEAVLAARRDIIRRAIRHSDGDYNSAAKVLGMHTNNLHKLITNLGIRDEIEAIRFDGKRK